MKRKLYTLNHDNSILKEINPSEIFTAKEHAYALEKEFGKTYFKSKEDFFRYFLPKNFMKIARLDLLINTIKENGYQNILSLGAGTCITEYFLKMSLPKESQVVACDFDSFLVKKTQKFFPEIIVKQFDFFEDDIESFQADLNIKFDLALFPASAYVMDDIEFINLFGNLKKNGFKQIIDFHAGYMDSKAVMREYLKPFRENSTLRKIFRKPPIKSGEFLGKFHGYSRSRGELRNLYKKSGLEILEETSTINCKYVAILG